MDLLTSPSFHHISPLTRSRSDVRSAAMQRSNSFSGLSTSRSTSGFTRPSYGYGGGYMARSLSKSGTPVLAIVPLTLVLLALAFLFALTS